MYGFVRQYSSAGTMRETGPRAAAGPTDVAAHYAEPLCWAAPPLLLLPRNNADIHAVAGFTVMMYAVVTAALDDPSDAHGSYGSVIVLAALGAGYLITGTGVLIPIGALAGFTAVAILVGERIRTVVRHRQSVAHNPTVAVESVSGTSSAPPRTSRGLPPPQTDKTGKLSPDVDVVAIPWQTVLDTVPAPLAVFRNREYLWGNRAFNRMTGNCESELACKDASMLFDNPRDFDRLMTLDAKDFANQGCLLVRAKLRTKGSSAEEALLAVGTAKEQGDRTTVLFVLFGLVEQERVDQLVKDLPTTISHELRTPLTSVLGYSELLLARPDMPQAERNECLEIIHNQARDLSEIVSAVLDVARVDAGEKLVLKIEPVIIGTLIDTVVSALAPRFPNVRFVVDNPHNEDVIHVDRRRVRDLFHNLLDNAAKYSNRTGEIRLKCTRQPDAFLFSIEDDGIGLLPDQAQRVFEKFYRVDASNTGIPGMGIGLTVSRYIIEAHGGSIEIESESGKGTCVWFTIPDKPSHHPSAGGGVEKNSGC